MPSLSPGCWATAVAADETDTVTALVRRGGGSKGVATYTCRINAASAVVDDKVGAPAGTATRRGLEHDPDWFEDKDVPPADLAGVAAKLKSLTANKWVAMLPPKALNDRCWGTQPTPFFAERHSTRLCATPQGIVAWAASKTVGSRRGLWLLKDLAKGMWEEILAPSPDALPPFSSGDSHAMAYDSKRDRLMFMTAGVKKDAQQLYIYDMQSRAVSVLAPKGAPHWPEGAGMVRELCYLPDDDLALICSTAKPSPVAIVFDPAREEWLKADIQPAEVKGRPVYPDGYHVSLGLMWDAKRTLIWASDVRGGIFVLRFERKSLTLAPLE